MSNRLANESSPYLLQHKSNPVDWYPWGSEALAAADREERPIFLSIGYSACHWCHVMAHESFENDEIAGALNERFVCIKVDREERPDLDQIYMNAVQMLTGRGGWPMSVFLTPDLQPFYAGTYWPPHATGGMPGFDEIIVAVGEAWQHRRDQALAGAAQLTAELRKVGALSGEPAELSLELLQGAERKLAQAFDYTHGGFGQAPKFPQPTQLKVLLRLWIRHRREETLNIVRLTLDKMAAGGIYDHLGGGFARYSVDARWLVPHFEKMLYDNALLAGAYLDGYLATGNDAYARVAGETLDYILRDMTDAAGGFRSAEDADSEGVEGKYYVWSPAELREVLGDEAAETFAYVYDVSEEGNFGDKNILNLPKTIEQCANIRGRDAGELADELAAGREKLFAVRSRRVRPGLDDKVLVSWNALAIDALAQAAGVLDEPRYLDAATRAADFILTHLRRDDGRLLHTWRGGTAKLDAYLDDYTSLINALVSLYEAGFEERFIDEAVRLADLVLELFADTDGDGFFYTARDHEPLITRIKDMPDSSVPSGNAMAATALVRLGKLCGRSDYVRAAAETFRAASGIMHDAPMAVGQMLLALDMYLGPTHELVLVGGGDDEATEAVLGDLRGRFLPRQVVAMRPADAGDVDCSPALAGIFAGKEPSGEGPTLYVCENFACEAPVTGKDAILATWERLAGA